MQDATRDDFDSLEDLRKALNREQAEWQKAGIVSPQINFNHLPQMLLDMTTRVQVLTNLLIENGLVEEEEVQFEFSLIMLNNMRAIRASVPEQEKDAIRRAIIEGAHTQFPTNHKPTWEQ